MFAIYYVVVALFTFWAVMTHRATQGKFFVALLSASVMPFALPFVPVIGLIAYIFRNKNES
jgi:hypothetical protein